MVSIISEAFRVLFGFLIPAVFAQPLPLYAIDPASFGPLCAMTGLCSASAPTGFGLLATFLQNLINVIRNVFIGVCAVYFAWFALMLIVKGSEENALTEQRKAFGYAVLGMGVVGVASLLVQTFAPSAAGAALVNATPFTDAAERIVTYITIVTGAFLLFVISFAGFRIIALQGNEGEIEKQKKSFFNGLLGMVVLLLARVTVSAILPSTVIFPAGGPGTASLIFQIAGMIKFLLEIVAGLAVISLIVSGVLFVVSLGSDERRQRAKRILTSTIIVLIVVVLSQTLIATFIP